MIKKNSENGMFYMTTGPVSSKSHVTGKKKRKRKTKPENIYWNIISKYKPKTWFESYFGKKKSYKNIFWTKIYGNLTWIGF